MSEVVAPVYSWLVEPMEAEVVAAVERVRRAPGVRHVAVMPDVHLATEVCVGLAVGTAGVVYPQAVGGDIGCGMLAVGFDREAGVVRDAGVAGRILARLGERVPAVRRGRRAVVGMPEGLRGMGLSHGGLEGVRRDEGVLQFGTLGSGNHFIELQEDEADGRLWLMLHSGSRVMGQVIRDHHLARAKLVGSGFKALAVGEEAGRAYVEDVGWARAYAAGSRGAMAEIVGEVVKEVAGARVDWGTVVQVDHNHVAREAHGGRELWVHRKGAMPAGAGEMGVVPGSMGTVSFHVEGRGCAAALASSAHGAGRVMSRHAARKEIKVKELERQMGGVWWDYRMGRVLCEEAPGAYKDVRAVVRAGRELVKVVRTLRPVVSYKGR